MPQKPNSPEPQRADEVDPDMVAQRESLPSVRDSLTHKFQIMGHEGYLTIGLFGDGRPGEIFVKMAKEGSTLSGLMQAYCRALSLALQYGLPLEEAVRRFKGMRFEPMGMTGNPDIPEAITGARTRKESLVLAEDALGVALAGYVYARWDIPTPSPAARGQVLVAVPSVVAAKLALADKPVA